MTNPMPNKRDGSPEKSLIRGHHHKRMQSLQPPNVNAKELGRSFDAGYVRSPDTSPERPIGRSSNALGFSRDLTSDFECSSPEKSPTKASTPMPHHKDSGRLNSSLRSTTRPPPRSILGDNTPPPSATMLALQTMSAAADAPDTASTLPSSSSLTRSPQTYEVLSSQIHSLTSIATSLQREMAQLSRRSKDNATDLISLKEATNARDEDIRQSLRELVKNLSHRLTAPPDGMDIQQGPSANGAYLLDSKPHASSTPTGRGSRSVVLPRIPSPSAVSAALERELASSPSPFQMDGAASLALLEKILRDMGTKEGQERLITSISQLLEIASRGDVDTAKRLEELTSLVKESSGIGAMVKHGAARAQEDGTDPGGSDRLPPSRDLEVDRSGPGQLVKARKDLTQRQNTNAGADAKKAFPAATSADGQDDDVRKFLKRLKDSVVENGGLTAEVKALVRELRGEVLGMGREMGRKLDQVGSAEESGNGLTTNEKEEMARIVQEGLVELKDHMDRVVRERRRRSTSSTISGNSLDSSDISKAVKHAVDELQLHRSLGQESADAALDKEDILDAIRESWETCKPEIELQNFGLERDEILQCLKEGLEEYRPLSDGRDRDGLSRQDVLKTIQDGLDRFTPPPAVTVTSEPSITREEILLAVRECLETFDFPRATGAPPEAKLSKEDVVDAVREGLGSFDRPRGRVAAREGALVPGVGEEVLDTLQGVIEGMRAEFKGVSDEAKENVAANGRDTEQVLDALKDGLEHLRSDIELYVDRAADVTGKDEIIESMRDGFERLRADIDTAVTGNATGPITEELLETVRGEVGSLRETLATTIVPHASSGTEETAAMLRQDLNDGFERLRNDLEAAIADNVPEPMNDEMFETIKGEISHLRDSLTTSVMRPGGSGQEETIAVLRESLSDGFERLRNDLEAAIADSVPEPMDDEMLASIKGEISSLRDSLATSVLRQGDLGQEETVDVLRQNLTDGFERLRGDLEACIVDSVPSPPAEDGLDAIRGEIGHLRETIATAILRTGSSSSHDEILDTIRQGLDDLRGEAVPKSDRPESFMSGTGEVLDALQDGLDTIRADIERLSTKPVDTTVSEEILETMKDGLGSIRTDIDQLHGSITGSREVAAVRPAEPNISEEMLEALKEGFAGIRADIERLHEKSESSRDLSPERGQVVVADSLKRNDIENLEVLIAQLRIKVEALDTEARERASAPESSTLPEGVATRDDLMAMEDKLKDIEAGIGALGAKEPADAATDNAKKEDVDALETLLVNTKAKIEELVSDLKDAANKADVDAIQLLVKDTKDAVNDIAAGVETGLANGGNDLGALEILTKEIRATIEEVKDRVTSKVSEGEEISKTDLDAIGEACMDIKTQIDQIPPPETNHLATKEQIDSVIDLLRDQHDKAQQDVELTINAMEDGKLETAGIAERLGDIKCFLEEVQTDLTTRFDDRNEEIEAMERVVNGIDEIVTANASTGTDIKEVMEILAREFERSHGMGEGLKSDQDQKSAEVLQKVDERFDELMTKYDDAQMAFGEAQKAAQKSSEDGDRAVNSVRTVADELKLSSDTLGISMTEAVDKLAQDSKTVFDRVEDTYSKVDETCLETKAGFVDTKAKADLVLGKLDGLQRQMGEQEPRIVQSVDNIAVIVRQHLEHAQQHADEVRSQAQQSSSAVTAELHNLIKDQPEPERYDDAQVQTKLDRIIDLAKVTTPRKDEEAHEKLDRIVDHASAVESSLAQMELLDQIHQQVRATASEVSAYFATQSKLLTEEREDKEKRAEEAAIALNVSLARKERVEQETADLVAERDGLRRAVGDLTADKDGLISQKTRLAAEVASLETARRIRHEELATMEGRAEALERRILEGVIDQSRALLISRRPFKDDPDKSMSLKRVPSAKRAASGVGLGSTEPAAVGVALKAKPPPIRMSAMGPTSSPGRRILSLNQITNNVPTGGQAFSGYRPSNGRTGGNGGHAGGLVSLKRSHSVKTAGSSRKFSLDSRGGIRLKNGGAGGKENAGATDAAGLDILDRDTNVASGGADQDSIDEYMMDSEMGSNDDDGRTETATVTTSRAGTTDDDFHSRRHSLTDGSDAYSESVSETSTASQTERRTSTASMLSGTEIGGAGSTIGGSSMSSRSLESDTRSGGRGRASLLSESVLEEDEDGEEGKDEDEDSFDDDDDDDDDDDVASSTQVHRHDYEPGSLVMEHGGNKHRGRGHSRGPGHGLNQGKHLEVELYNGPADSGVGEDLPTADLEGRRFEDDVPLSEASSSNITK